MTALLGRRGGFLRAKPPFLARGLARAFLDTCSWVDAEPGRSSEEGAEDEDRTIEA